MASNLKVKVVTPQGSMLSEEANAFTARSGVGEFCILPNHRPIMAALEAGRMVIEFARGEKTLFALDRGFLEAGEDHVNVITERCVPFDKLDSAALVKEKAELEKRLAQIGPDAPESKSVVRALEWCDVRLEIADKPLS